MKIVIHILILIVLIFVAKQIYELNKMHQDFLVNVKSGKITIEGLSISEVSGKRTPIVVKVENKIEKVADSAMSVFGALKQGMIARGY